MEQGLELGRDVEIAGLVLEIDVGHRKRGRDQFDAETTEMLGRQEHETGERARGKRCGQCRKPAAQPAQEEVPKAKAARGRVLVADQAGDQESADDEEHVDAQKAAGKREKAEVEDHDRQHGDGAQPVDVRPVTGARHACPSPTFCRYRLPKIAEPTRTRVAPKRTASA